MADLVQWLTDQLDSDERIARAATQGPWSVDNEEYAEAIYGPDGRTTVVAGGRWGGEASVFETTEDAIHIADTDPAWPVPPERWMRIGNAWAMPWKPVEKFFSTRQTRGRGPDQGPRQQRAKQEPEEPQ